MFHVTYLIRHGTPLLRVCRFLRQLSRCHNNAVRFPLDMTQIELASVLDMHRVSLFRCLQQLRDMGLLLHFSRREVLLSDVEELDAFLQSQEDKEWD